MEILSYFEFSVIAGVLLYILAIASALEAMLKARTPQGAIAWTISLLSLPFLTVPVYLVFGRNRFDGYLEQREYIEAASYRLIADRSSALRQHVSEADSPLYTSLCKLARMPATTGNHVELLIDGSQTYDSIASGVERATQYVLFQFYIIRDDEVGRRLGKVLADRARDGVRVYLLYDEIGSRAFPGTGLYKQLKMTGVQVAPFNTTQGRRNRLQLNFRNHRKVVVVDGREAWLGGLNLGEEYLGRDKKIGDWRDTHVRFSGPAVLGAEVAFATDWLWATRSILDVEADFSYRNRGENQNQNQNQNQNEKKNEEKSQNKDECTVLVFPSDPASVYEEAGLMYHQIIVAAKERIWIASPYFVPDRAIISALQLAALRGVDVRIIIPEKADGPVMAMANWSYTGELLPLGIKVYRYQRGFMHQKVFLMDNTMAGVGTANFDNRSFRLNFEITLLVDNSGFASKVEKMLQDDLDQCTQVTLADIQEKPAWFPFAMGAARLFSPLL
jgi:cardiolipin synthase